jgi:hypothetical protein
MAGLGGMVGYSASLLMEHPPCKTTSSAHTESRPLPPSSPLRYRQAPRMMYHTPGDIIICPRVRAAEITRESAAASSWSESDLLRWLGTEKPPRGLSMSEWEEDWPDR